MRIQFFICLLLLASCGKTPSHKKPLLLVSIAPYQFLTERIAGENYSIQTVVPAGANPHVYEPTARQLSEISRGAIWFRIGEAFEAKILPVIQQQNPQIVDVDLRRSIELLHAPHHGCSHCAHDNEDRHIWLSPKAALIQIDKIANALVQRFPEDQPLFLANAKILAQECAELDREIYDILSPVTHRTFLVSHPAFAYFCKDYNCTQLSVEQDGKEPRPRQLEEIIQRTSASKTKLAIALPQHSNKGLEILAKKLDLSIHTINPYSAEYFETLRLLAHTIRDNE